MTELASAGFASRQLVRGAEPGIRAEGRHDERASTVRHGLDESEFPRNAATTDGPACTQSIIPITPPLRRPPDRGERNTRHAVVDYGQNLTAPAVGVISSYERLRGTPSPSDRSKSVGVPRRPRQHDRARLPSVLGSFRINTLKAKNREGGNDTIRRSLTPYRPRLLPCAAGSGAERIRADQDHRPAGRQGRARRLDDLRCGNADSVAVAIA